MKLYLMRHGQAFSALDDPKRPLTPQGRDDVARVLCDSELKIGDIGEILHSDVTRTRETADIVAKQLGVSKVTACPKWLAEHADIDDGVMLIASLESDTMLVSHQPFLIELMNYLLPGKMDAVQTIPFSTATIVALEKSEDDQWHVNWIVSP